MRFLALLAALVVLAWPSVAAAQAKPDPDAPFVPQPIPELRPREAPIDKLPDGPSLEPFRGLKITSAEVIAVNGASFDDEPVPKIKSVTVGQDLATPEVARRALADALESGRVARGRVVFELDGSGGVKLTVLAVPRKLIAALRLDLHGANIERDELQRESELSPGGEFIALDADGIKQRIADYYMRHGYPSATVSLTVRATDDPQRVLVFLDIQPGKPWTIEQRKFIVTGDASEAVRGMLDGYATKVGDRFDETTLAVADGALESKLRANGYPKATASHEVGVAAKLFTLRVKISTGPRTIARFAGNDSYDEGALTAVIQSDTDLDRSPLHLADKVKTFYIKRGFLDVEVTPELRNSAGLVAIVFHIVEHPRVSIRRRAYPCLDESKTRSPRGAARAPPRRSGRRSTATSRTSSPERTSSLLRARAVSTSPSAAGARISWAEQGPRRSGSTPITPTPRRRGTRPCSTCRSSIAPRVSCMPAWAPSRSSGRPARIGAPREPARPSLSPRLSPRTSAPTTARRSCRSPYPTSRRRSPARPPRTRSAPRSSTSSWR